MTRDPPFFECPDCGKDIADSLPHAADCPQAMTREPCRYCGQEDRYGHDALCVMNTVEELHAEVGRLKVDNKRLKEVIQWQEREYGLPEPKP